MATVEVRAVSKSYRLNHLQQVLALKDIDFFCSEGDFVALIGPSGCGKSTLLHLIAGLDHASGGSIRINGNSPSALREQHRLGIAFQDHALLPWLSVKANLALPFKIARLPVDNLRISHLIELVGLQGFEHARPSQLSGGMRQRAAIARSLCLNPDLLLLDEPFGALDAVTRRRMNIEIQRIWIEKKVTTIMVTHSVDEALFLADRIVVLSGRPGVVIYSLDVPFPRPRLREDIRSEAFHRLSDELTQLLEH